MSKLTHARHGSPGRRRGWLAAVALGATLMLASAATCPAQCAASKVELPGSKPLASHALTLAEATEVGLEVEARSPGASWAKKGAEAAALLVAVDGVYNQDLLLWAGDESFVYRVLLGRLAPGRHTVSVWLNPARSAASAGRAEVRALRPLPLTPAPGEGAGDETLALAHAPVLFARANAIDRFTDVPLLMYYEARREPGGDLVVRYTAIFSHEDGGTPAAALMARWGRTTDIEWVYQVRLRGDRAVEETYQGVEHETKTFGGARVNGNHPLLAVASDNNNFSHLACSAVRFAPLPVSARLDASSREIVMDLHPWTYRVMAEELEREARLSEAPADLQFIADPREYLYVEAYAEQEGTALAIEVVGDAQLGASDLGIDKLRVDRSGFFRVAVRLPRGTAGSIASISIRCHATERPAGERLCRDVALTKAFTLDREYLPRELQLRERPRARLAPGETAAFVVAR